MTGQRRIELLAVSAFLSTVVVLTVPTTAVRAVFAVPLCLIFPGYALASAVFPRQPLSGVQTAMLTLALSFGTLVIGSVVLNLLPGGLRLDSWSLLLLVVVLVGAVTAAQRGPGPLPRSPRRIRLRLAEMAAIGLALMLAGGAFALSRIPLRAPHAVGYTELWMLSGNHGSGPAVRIGMRSAEQSKTSYRLVILPGGGRPFPIARHLVLEPGGAAQFEVPITLSAPTAALVTAQLFRAGQTAPYRQATALLVPPFGGFGVHLLSPRGP